MYSKAFNILMLFYDLCYYVFIVADYFNIMQKYHNKASMAFYTVRKNRNK